MIMIASFQVDRRGGNVAVVTATTTGAPLEVVCQGPRYVRRRGHR